MDLLIILALLIIACFVGGAIERKHFKELKQKEFLYSSFLVVNKEDVGKDAEFVGLVSGNVVIGHDYFKAFLFAIRNLFGGRVRAYETLMERARREAIIRAKEKAISQNANAIVNLRVETVKISIGGGQNKLGCFEAIAYGTAVKINKNIKINKPVINNHGMEILK